MDRYARNEPALSAVENCKLRSCSVCVVGAGGIGGYALEMLTRLGIGRLTIIDGDSFEPSNLNRQRFCTEQNIGRYKASEAALAIKEINTRTIVNPHVCWLKQENAQALLCGHNAVIDALDSASGKLLLDKNCRSLGIPYIHGAIGGWKGQLMTVFPEDRGLPSLYHSSSSGEGNRLGAPAFLPALVAAAQVGEAVKVLLGKKNILRNTLLYIDLEHNLYKTIAL